MQSAFRPLAPAPPGGAPEPSGSELRKRKKKARLACNHCRLKRIGCDGARPDCARCLRSRVPCVWLSEDADATPTMALKSEVESLQRRLQEHTDFVEAIRNAPDDEVLAIIQQLRLSEDLSAVLSSFQGRIDGPSRLSEHVSARAAMSSTETCIEFELATLHATTIPALEATGPSSIAPASLPAPNTPSNGLPISASEPDTYCDPRLELLIVSYWTRIPIDNVLAARTISHFLQIDLPIFGFFDPDLFLRDLVGQGLTFCSSFLFHAVMSLACQSYRALDLRVNAFITVFTEEAIKLWQAERSTDATTTLAAMHCLSAATGCDGSNEFGNHQLVTDARAMARRMQLLDVAPTNASTVYLGDLEEDEMRDQTHVAWDSYGQQSFRASFFPSPSIRYRPTLSISGGNPDIFATSDAFEPAHHELTCMSRMFTVLSQSWTMVQEIAAVYNKGDDAPLFERVKSSLAKAKYQQLLAWADDLSPWPSNNLSSAAHVSILKYRPP